MSIKADFPYFNVNLNNQEAIVTYLDNAATTQKPQVVIDALTHFYTHQNSNVHRSTFAAANQLTSEYEDARQCVANFIGSSNKNNIVWTKGTTESINLVAYAWGEHHINLNDHIMVLGSEHHANFIPWQQLAKRKHAHLDVVNLTDEGAVDIEHFKQLLINKPKLIAMQHCSNALGNIQPVKELLSLAKSVGATTLIDGAQAVAHIDINVEELDCDFYAFSGHKMYGPMGIGVLYIKDEIKQKLMPFQFGGEMVDKVRIKDTSFRTIPSMLETGTPNVAGVLGFRAAINFLQQSDVIKQRYREKELYQYLINELNKIPKIKLYGDQENNIGVVSFTIEGESVADVATLLDQQNIAVRCGHHCAMPLMQALGIDGTIRVSIAIYNTYQDINLLIEALTNAIRTLTIDY